MRSADRFCRLPVGGGGAFLLRTETELILKSRRVVPARLLEAGFTFRFPEWAEAARDLASRWRAKRRATRRPRARLRIRARVRSAAECGVPIGSAGCQWAGAARDL